MKPGMLLIRADAGSVIGTGHVMRCLALAQAWQDAGGTVTLAAAELPAALHPRLEAEHVAVTGITAASGSLEDALATNLLANRTGASWIVIDGDRFSSEYLEHVRGRGVRILLVDDLLADDLLSQDFAARKSFPADLIVNPNLDEASEAYENRSAGAAVCAGPSYILLRREFQQAAREQATRERNTRETGNRILVTLGGSDPDGMTLKIAAALANCPGMEVTALAGAGYASVDELQTLSNVRILVNTPKIAQCMLESDIAIIAAGGTLWELLSTRCAVLSYSRNAVQARIVRVLAERGMIRNLGKTREFAPAPLVAAIQQLAGCPKALAEMTALGATLVDGRGASRVVATMLRMGQR